MEDFRHVNALPERLLVTGVDGIAGANVALSLADRFTVLGLFEHHPVSLPGCTTFHWGPADPAAWTAVIRRNCPHWIIHCGPMARSSWDVPEESPDAETEPQTCTLLGELAAELGSRLTVISTDAVFAGPRLFHAEPAAANSRTPFAQAVCRAEEALEATGALVVRTHTYGWSPAGALPGFAERVWQTLIEDEATHFDPDRHATPILATDLAEFLRAAYHRGLEGCYHVAGAERTSAYRFAIELAAAFGLSSAPSVDEAPARCVDSSRLNETSLSTSRARRELGRAMPMLREGLDSFAQQARDGFRARLQGSAPRTVVTADAA
jgi:dTDP-4-dehydrorhamnose reductase